MGDMKVLHSDIDFFASICYHKARKAFKIITNQRYHIKLTLSILTLKMTH